MEQCNAGSTDNKEMWGLPVVNMNCDCKDWVEGNKEMRRIFTLAYLKGIESYKGKEFTHCPYCGEGLVPYYKWVMPNWRASSVDEDKAMSSYVKDRYVKF